MSVEPGVIKKPGRLPALDRSGLDSSMMKRTNLFSRKGGKQPGEIEMVGKDDASPDAPKTNVDQGMTKKKKTGFVNRKNVAHGMIYIAIKNEDRVVEDTNLEYRDNFIEVLDSNPQRISSFMENLKTGSFYEIYNTAVINLNPEKVVSVATTQEHIENELGHLVFEYDDFLRKVIVFFQGLLAGLSILHIYLILFESNDLISMQGYSRYALRLNQIFQVIAMISCTGTLLETIKYYKLYQESRRKQSEDLAPRSKMYNLNRVAFILFLIAYGIVIFLHEFAAVVSVNNSSIALGTLPTTVSNRIIMWKLLNVIGTVAAVFAWLLVVKNSYSDENATEDMLEDDATHDGNENMNKN